MEYFKGCKTQDHVKRLYRQWAKKLHPDVGGNEKEMIELQRQYDKWIKPNHFAQSGQMSEEEFKQASEAWGKEFEGKAQYGGYGGYRYNNQKNDHRLADYERMKKQYENIVAENIALQRIRKELEKENESLKKKLERLTNKLKKPPKKKNEGKSIPTIYI